MGRFDALEPPAGDPIARIPSPVELESEMNQFEAEVKARIDKVIGDHFATHEARIRTLESQVAELPLIDSRLTSQATRLTSLETYMAPVGERETGA